MPTYSYNEGGYSPNTYTTVVTSNSGITIGAYLTATGDYSIAMGLSNVAISKYSTVAGGLSNILSGGQLSFVAGGSGNKSQYSNTFTLGSNITAISADFTYVNNISVQNDLRTAGAILSANKNLSELFEPKVNGPLAVGLRLTQLTEIVSRAQKSDILYIVSKSGAGDSGASRSYNITVNNLALGIRYNTDISYIFDRAISVYNKVNTLSSNWDSSYNTVKNLSSTWCSTYNSVKTTSACWDKASTDSFFACDYIKNILVDVVYPVGSIITNNCCINPTSWNSLLTAKPTIWERYGQGKVFVGEGRGTDTNGCSRTFKVSDNSANCGEYYVKLNESQLPRHDHGFNDPGHCHLTTHTLFTSDRGRTGSGGGDVEFDKGGPGDITICNSKTNINFNAAGGNQPHTNIQPYMVVYSWIRIA